MPQIVCRICLRSDFNRSGTIDKKLAIFYGELCYVGIYQSAAQFCPICEHQLKKFYNFRQQCRRAQFIFQSSRQKNNLQELLSSSSLGNITHSTRQAEYHYIYLDPHTTIQIDHQKFKDEHTNNQPTSDASIHLDHVYEASRIEDIQPYKESDFNDGDNDLEHHSKENVLQQIQKQEHVLQDSGLQEHDLEDTDLKDTDLQDTGLQDTDLQDTDITDIDLQLHYSENNDNQSNDSSDNDIEWDSQFSDSDIEDDKKKHHQGKKRKFGDEIDDNILNDEDMLVIDNRFLALKLRILQLLEYGEFQDLGHPMNKEIFLKMFEKVDKTCLTTTASSELPRLRRYLLALIKRFDPKYDSVFDIQYLTTTDEKLAEFHQRSLSKEYLAAEIKCELCFKVFENQKYLDYHNNWHQPSREHACSICAMRFTSHGNMRDHEQRDHYTVCRCRLCPVVTRSFDAMVNHYHLHKGVKYSCDLCPTVTSSRSALSSHRIQQHATLSCRVCARRFVSHAGLSAHTKSKHGDSELVRTLCADCGASFETARALREHAQLAHTDDNSRFRCRYLDCKMRFASVEELMAHRAVARHSAALRRCKRARGELLGYRTCTVCGEQIANTSALALYRHHQTEHPDVHYAVATAGKILCEQCGKSFRMKASYLEHLNFHTGARPFACTLCPKRFARQTRLATHMERHGPKKYRCEQCGKMYPTSANLWQHTQTHTGIRRFKCDTCAATFVHSAGLAEHVRGVHLHIRRVKNKPIKVEKTE